MSDPNKCPVEETKLDFYGKYRSSILQGTKRITIREGLRVFKRYVTVLGYSAIVNEQYQCKLSDVPFSYFQFEGWKNVTEMLKGIREIYPNITLDSDVTVVEFRLDCPLKYISDKS